VTAPRLAAELEVLRAGVVRHRRRPALVWVSGEHAYEVVEGICPRDLFIRSGRVLTTLLLDEDGRVEADLAVCARGDEYLLLADGIDDAGLCERLRAHAPGDARFELEPASPAQDLIGVSGPYAWELMRELLGPEVVTIRYLDSIALPERVADPRALCLRLGTTGEYGYELLLPPAEAAKIAAEIAELGPRFDLVEVAGSTLDLAALENGFFCPRHRGVLGRSPLELQLQWRVAYDLEFRGADALRRARAEGPTQRRLTWVIGRLDDEPPERGPLHRRDGDDVDAEVGELLDGFVSPLLGCFVGLAMVDRTYAHPWIAGLFDGGGRELRCEAPPLIQNRSLFVDPSRHSYACRDEDSGEFPPIVPGAG